MRLYCQRNKVVPRKFVLKTGFYFVKIIEQIMITYEDFTKIDIRAGKIIEVLDFPEAKKPSFRLVIDFGPEIGTKKSSGQFVANYSKDFLLGKQVACVVNFPPKQIGPFVSEVLTLGFPDEQGNAVLIIPTKDVPLGGKLF